MSNKLFVATLLFDVEDALGRQRRHDTATARRDIVRTTFAAIEGISWMYRGHVSNVLDDMGLLSYDEKAVLNEYQHSVNDRGKISSQRRFMPVVATIRLSCRLVKKADEKTEFDFGGAGWQNLMHAVNIRNRITHPKAIDDMEVSAEDASRSLAALYWLLEISTDAMDASNKALKLQTEGLRKILAELKAGDPIAWSQYEAAKENLDFAD